MKQSPDENVGASLADLFRGNEIDRSQERQFIGLLRGLAINQETTILILARPFLSGVRLWAEKTNNLESNLENLPNGINRTSMPEKEDFPNFIQKPMQEPC